MEGQQNNIKDHSGLTIKDLFFKYVRFLPVFLVSVAICLFAAFLYLRYTTPIYRVGGTITFKTEENTKGGKFDDIFLAKNVSDIQTEIEILKSKPLMERVVDTANLQTNYYAIGKIKTLNVYKSCPFRLDIRNISDSATSFTMNFVFTSDNEFRVNKETTLYKIGDFFQNAYGIFRVRKVFENIAGKEYDVVWNTAPIQASLYAPIVRVTPKIVGSNIYNIQVDLPNAQLGADIINNLMREYLDASIEDKNITIKQRLDYINDQLAFLKKDLDSIESKLIIYKKNNSLTDASKQTDNYFSIIRESDNVVNKQRLDLKVAELLEEYLMDADNNFEKVPSTLGLDNLQLTKIVEIYNSLQLERKNMLERRIPEGNPSVKAKTAEIEVARKNILELMVTVKDSYRNVIDDYYRRSSNAQSNLNQLPEKVQRMLEMERDRDSKLALYKFMQEQREETAMSQASTISNSKILEMAAPTNVPIRPNRRAIQLLAIIMGIGLPAMYIFFQEIVNDKVNTRHDIEKLTDASILGEVGHSYGSSAMVVSKTNRSMVSEQFRIIRSNLQYVLNKIDKPVIMVTSSFSSEGKSFISTNLGGVMSLAGKKTVILEFDIRKPKLFTGLRISSRRGITNFLVGKADIEELPVKISGFENLYAISCGPVPPNPSELLLDSRVGELFDWLKENFDVIILDTAPVGMVSDAMTLGKFADSTLYIVRQGYTYKKQISLIDEFYQENRLPKISIIINDVKIKPGYGYYGYGRYGYGYGYGAGYYEDDGIDLPRSIRVLEKIKSIFRKKPA